MRRCGVNKGDLMKVIETEKKEMCELYIKMSCGDGIDLVWNKLWYSVKKKSHWCFLMKNRRFVINCTGILTNQLRIVLPTLNVYLQNYNRMTFS